ncbi:hypothetical protein [Neobacillus niacini]|uniref:hypothetical protein n=1 Tax=Neobacillus niacini TaxID=86668 RepID=UPI0005EFE30B|nr:hypothetical protein [Neobacillus niacini]
MKKWAISAIVYLLVVVGGYYVYASVAEPDSHGEEKTEHNEKTVVHEDGSDESHEEGHEENDDSHNSVNEVQSSIQLENEELVITLTDLEGKPVSDLEVNHEKLLHLIVVSSDLKEYQHLHPETNEPGVFKVSHSLKEGEYKAFVDIKPKGKNYQVEPISFAVGEKHDDHSDDVLQADTALVREVGGHKAILEPSSLQTNEDIELKFDLAGETPEQYLGALGHVVVLDEKGEKYIHVHPLEGNEPVFATEFHESGIYKIWAEFKLNGEVFVFPYVVEIK